MGYLDLAVSAWEYTSGKGGAMPNIKVNDWVQRTCDPLPGMEPFD